MEILYVWINKDDKGLLCETGINFSPEFQFELLLLSSLNEFKSPSAKERRI